MLEEILTIWIGNPEILINMEVIMIKKSMIILCLGAFVLFACKGSDKAEGNAPSSKSAANTKPLDADTSYAFGMAFSSQFKDMGLDFDYDAFVRGFREYLEGKDTRFSLNEAMTRVNTVYNEVMAAQTETLQQEEMAYLAENSKKDGIIVTPSGLQYEVITQGTGQKPKESDTVQVHYQGALIDGTIFDSSYSRGEPTEFLLSKVIPGWIEGIQLMNEGSTYRFYIPSELAYGQRGFGEQIPPYATLVFEVELLSIINL